MTSVVRMSRSPGAGDLIDSVEALEAFAREHGPRLYDVEKP